MTTPSSSSRTGAGPSRLRDLRLSLSSRDHQILQFLSRHRYATTTHLRDVYFADHATATAGTRACVRVLHRLLRDRLVARLERRVGGTARGSAASIWYLDAAGERLTRDEDAARRRFASVSTVFLEHTLGVVDVHVALIAQTRRTGTQLECVAIEAEAWRSFFTAHGTTTILKPDLYAHLATAEFDDYWYIEWDAGSESIPVVLAKCRTYAAYKATGRAQAEHGVFPRVLWIVPSQRRAERLTSAIHRYPELPNRLFTVITPDQLAATIDPATDTETTEPRKEQL
ncbi:replication-relaxation family protein [Microbacterium sp. NPDC089180]|uniref:replication-relaxation family protein n=1 Tax=unclassified Microbacterium TaxID=2609290 RepID=UPI003433B35C